MRAVDPTRPFRMLDGNGPKKMPPPERVETNMRDGIDWSSNVSLELTKSGYKPGFRGSTGPVRIATKFSDRSSGSFRLAISCDPAIFFDASL